MLNVPGFRSDPGDRTWPADGGPPRLVLRFAVWTGIVLVLAGFAIFWLVHRDVTNRAERAVESQARTVAEATLSRRLRASDFDGPVSARRRAELDALFRDRVYLQGVLRASLVSPGGMRTYSTDRALIGTRQRVSDVLPTRSTSRVTSLDERGGPKVLRTFIPVRRHAAGAPIGVLSLSQDYKAVEVQTPASGARLAAILGLALLALYGSLFPILRRVTAQLEARNRRLREQAEALQQRREHHRLIVETAVEAFVGTDSAGLITDWNPRAVEMFGWSREEALGRSYLDLIVPERHRDEHAERLAHLGSAHAAGPVEPLELTGIRRDGTEFLLEARISAVRLGDELRFNAFLHDITERKQAEQEREILLAAERAARAEAESAQVLLTEQNERLRELDRLKDEFLSLVSHELRTPLTSIRGYVELVLDEEAGDLNPEQRRFLKAVDRNSGRLLRLVGDLLFVAQADAGRLTLEQAKIDVAALAAECVEAARPIADQKAIDLRLAAVPVPALVGDRGRLAQVLDNLISNALKFTPESGSVEVSTATNNGHVLVEVRDSGIGIPADEQPRLFERFYRAASATEQAIPGTGLGLAIVKAIVEAHGGRIDIDSKPGDGTTFTIALPLRVESETAATVEAVA
jgi:PAS domain S-box-containing protein